MPMERSNSSGSTNSSYSTTSRSSVVVSIQCLKGSSKADEWTGNMLITGDIVEEIRIGNMILRSPFKNGKNGIQKVMHNSFKAKETSISVRVRRGSQSDDESFTELQACIVPNEFGGRKNYMLRAIDDPNYAVGFVDRTEMECLELQASRKSRMVGALTRTPLQEGYVSYPWEKRMNELLAVPKSSNFYSLLLLPKASDKVSIHYNDLEDTLSRANAWLIASQASGVPIVFMNIQTESLLTKISGETASCTVSAGSLSDLSNLANASLYGFEDYHGVDIGVVRAVRLWFSPLGGEYPIDIKIKENDVKLGFAISRTEEGFIHISSVSEEDDDAPSSRSGLSKLYKEAMNECKLLVVSRISNQKVLPWIVSPTGAVRCFDTVSLSQKLSLHRHAKVPILMHLFLWDRSVPMPNGGSINRSRTISPTMLPPLAPEVRLARQPNDNQVMPLPLEVEYERGSRSHESELRHDRDTADALQSFIADSYKDEVRGTGFGFLNLIGTVGGIGGGAIATVMAGHEYWGVPGWRFAFILMATLSTSIGFLVFSFVVDPWKKSSGQHDISKYPDRDELIEKGHSNITSMSIWMESWTAMKTVIKVQTFQFIVLQGLVGSLPWTAFVFFTLWFELIGFDHNSAAALVSLFAAGCALGSFFGGVVADKMSRIYPHSGRVMCAQFSSFMGIPFSWFLLRIVPPSVSSYSTFAVTLFIMGLTISWCATATNGPMFAEVVPSKHRTMIYAFDRAFEGSFSSFAAPIVGILAEKMYGYDAKSVDPLLGSPNEALALSKGLFSMMAVPFGLCCLFYTPLYWTFKQDRENARLAAAKETEMM